MTKTKMDGLQTFYLTFGKKYPWRNGWVEVCAVNYEMARKLVVEVFGDQWAWLHREEDFNKENYKAGRIGEIMF